MVRAILMLLFFLSETNWGSVNPVYRRDNFSKKKAGISRLLLVPTITAQTVCPCSVSMSYMLRCPESCAAAFTLNSQNKTFLCIFVLVSIMTPVGRISEMGLSASVFLNSSFSVLILDYFPITFSILYKVRLSTPVTWIGVLNTFDVFNGGWWMCP